MPSGFGDQADVRLGEQMQRKQARLGISNQGILRLWALGKTNEKVLT